MKSDFFLSCNITNFLVIFILLCANEKGYAQHYTSNNKKFVAKIVEYDSLTPIKLNSGHYTSGGAKDTEFGLISYDEQDEKYVGQSTLLPKGLMVFRYPTANNEECEKIIKDQEYVITHIFSNNSIGKFARIGEGMLKLDAQRRLRTKEVEEIVRLLSRAEEHFMSYSIMLPYNYLIEVVDTNGNVTFIRQENVVELLRDKYIYDYELAKRSVRKKMKWEPQEIEYDGLSFMLNTKIEAFEILNSESDNVSVLKKDIELGEYKIIKKHDLLFTKNLIKQLNEQNRDLVLQRENSYGINYFSADPRASLDGLVELVGKEKKDTIVMALSGIHEYNYVSVGHINKIISLFAGSKFIVKASEYYTGQFYFEDYYNEKEKLPADTQFVELEFDGTALAGSQLAVLLKYSSGTFALPVLKCKRLKDGYDIPNEYWRLIVGANDEDKEKYLSNKEFYYLVTPKYFLFDKRIYEEVCCDLKSTYGSKYADAIIKGDVIIGMTTDMCEQAWGGDKWGSRSTDNYNSGTWSHAKGKLIIHKGRVSKIETFE